MTNNELICIIDDNLRVNAKLINIIEDKTVWSNTYNNKLTDIFMVQDGIAEQIVSQLNEKLTISSADISATKRAYYEKLFPQSEMVAGSISGDQQISDAFTHLLVLKCLNLIPFSCTNCQIFLCLFFL